MSTPREVTEFDTGSFGTVPVVDRACPLCGRDNGAEPANRYSHPPWEIKDCGACGFVYIDKAPLYEAQASTMAWERTTKVEQARRAELRPLSHWLSKSTRARMRLVPRLKVHHMVDAHAQSGPVLDLGCGDGGQLAKLAERFVPFGVEISEHLARAANERLAKRGGRAVNAPSLEGIETFADAFFSAATLRSYLEHETRPGPVLGALHRVLAPGAVAIVKVPNYGSLNRVIMGKRWSGFRYPDHLNYFTPRTLRAMAEARGYRPRSRFIHRLPTSDNMYAILTKV